jgi:hypothetical protein
MLTLTLFRAVCSAQRCSPLSTSPSLPVNHPRSTPFKFQLSAARSAQRTELFLWKDSKREIIFSAQRCAVGHHQPCRLCHTCGSDWYLSRWDPNILLSLTALSCSSTLFILSQLLHPSYCFPLPGCVRRYVSCHAFSTTRLILPN